MRKKKRYSREEILKIFGCDGRFNKSGVICWKKVDKNEFSRMYDCI